MRRLLPFSIALLALWLLLCVFVGSRYMARRVRMAETAAREDGLATANRVASRIRYSNLSYRSFLTALSRQSDFKDLLKAHRHMPKEGPRKARDASLLKSKVVRELNVYLDELTQDLNVDLVFVINAEGISLSSARSAQRESTIGLDYSDRAYFMQAKEKGRGYQFAMGRTTKVAGFYFSQAIYDGNLFLGVVVMKVDSSTFQAQLKSQASSAYVTDHNDVVVVSLDPSISFMRSSENALPSSDELKKHYGRSQFERLPMRAIASEGVADLVAFGPAEEHRLLATAEVWGMQLWVHLLMPIQTIEDARHAAYLRVLLTALVGCVVIGLLALGLGRLQKVEALANVDPLTQAYNRRSLFEMGDRDFLRARRQFSDLCALMIDIDHFKRINDTHGHAAGDEALKAVASACMRLIRKPDLFARYGGEEFALLLPDTSLKRAHEVAERLRQSISELRILVPKGELTLSVSLGLAEMSPVDQDLNALLQRADHALYKAKEMGRNRVEVAE
jgi:diguanylate cyclase (GGDEF)-like protein